MSKNGTNKSVFDAKFSLSSVTIIMDSSNDVNMLQIKEAFFMRKFKKAMALLCALTLLVTCTIAGLALPVSAEGDTFKLMYDELYLAPKDSGGYVVYGASPALNLDGTPYKGTLTWSSSKTSVASINSSTGRITTAATGTTVITATNEAGESHSCTVHVTWDGERVGGGDMESDVLLATNRWTSGFLKGNVKVVDDPYDDGTNRVMEFPNGSPKGNYYYYLCVEKSTKYMLSFDVRGELNNGAEEIVVGYLSNSNKTGNIYAKPVGDRWKHYYWTFTTTSSANRNYVFNICNQNLEGGSNTNSIYIDNISLVALGTAESVAMDSDTLTLMEGQSETMTLTPTPADGTLNHAVWTSSNEDVATVDKDGKITAVSKGTATITATCGLIKATCEVTVTGITATGIVLDKTTLDMKPGDTETLTASVVPEGADFSEPITWRSLDETVATVVDGTVTAVRGGSTMIMAEAGDFTAACVVTVSASSASDTFKLAKDELYLSMTDAGGYIVYGYVQPLNLDGTPYTEALTWSSSNTSILAVNSTSGRLATISAQKKVEGESIITATNAAGESHSCKVYVSWEGECVSGGDFEAPDATGMYSLNRWTSILASGKATIVEEADGNHCLKIPAGMDATYIGNLTSLPSTTYRVSFDIKGDTGEIKPLYINNSTANGWKFATPKANEWKHVSWTYTVKSSVNRSYQVGLANMNISGGTNTNPIYIDNLSIVALGTAESVEMNTSAEPMEIGDELQLSISPTPSDATFNRPTWTSSNEAVALVDKNGKVTAVGAGTAVISAKSGTLTAATCTVTVYSEFLAAIPDPSLENGAIETDGTFGEVEAEDIVTVTVTPEVGYLMIPGSLHYTKKDGTVVRVLNKNLSTDAFGQGAGNSFQFVMPDEKVSLKAEFIPVTEQNFAANTIGTSCRYTLDENDEKVYDGIRFLTRMNLANKFDAESNTLTVVYGGVEYTVVEFGSLLKREQNTTKLTYDNAVASTGASGLDRMWISKAYTKDNGNFVLVDYTESYIDFTSVMMTKFYDRFYTARGYIRLQAADESIITLEFDEITNSISTVVPILPPVQALEGVTIEKTCDTPVSHTVEPNWKLTYNINVTAGDKAGTVTVFEPIPANTMYVGGADQLVGKTAYWIVDLEANETKTLTYTVQVANDTELYNGGAVVATDTQVGNDVFKANHTIYIERSVSKYDEYFVNQAVKALGDSQFTDLKLIYWTYYVAYSNSITDYSTGTASALLNSIIAGTDTRLDNVAPTLYGGTSVSGPIAGIKGAPAASVSESDLMIGDMLLVKDGGVTSIYLYCDKGLMKVRSEGGFEAADVALISTLTSKQAYAVVRPRASFTATSSTDPEAKPVELDARQEAVIKTGEAFLMRGDKVQYDDTRFGNPWGSNEYRWRLHTDAPEDASYEYIKYTNCAAFCNDSYYFGLNYSLPGNMFTTFNMVNATAAGKQYAAIRKLSVVRSVTDTHTEEEAEQLYNDFMSIIQPGDLMIVLRDTNADGDDDSGHVMMYIGNGKMIHSSGSNYNSSTGTETVEPSIRYGQTKDYFFRPAGSNFIYGTQVSKFAVIRPLDLSSCPKDVPENTVNRLNNLTGIVAQKYASVRPGFTLNNGETITYTFDIRNTTNEAKTFVVKDTVPTNAVYVSGAETIEGTAMSWTVTVPADGKVSFSYTVKVADDAPAGAKIVSSGTTIADVAMDCPAITVANTLTADEQAAILEAAKALKAEGTTLTGIALVNEIYKRAGIADVTFADTDYETIANGENGILVPTAVSGGYQRYELAPVGNTYRDMIAPSLYGGMYLDTPKDQLDRTRLAYQDDLVIGDVIIGRYTSGYSAYIYLGGDYLVQLSNLGNDTKTVDDRLAYIPSWRYFYAVLRPSMLID